MFRFTKQICAVLAGLLAFGFFFASPAGAELKPAFQPGGNGPDEPEPPFVIGEVAVLPVFPSASVAVSCAAETAAVTVKNPTTSAFVVSIEVDGHSIGGGLVGAKNQRTETFPLAENATKSVEVARGNVVMLDKEATRDCLLPAPAYQVLSSCDAEQAHVRLINNGDDDALMAVQYGDDAYAHQTIAPHSSKDWLLDVAANGSVAFKVLHNSTVLGSEMLHFDCAVEPPVEPPVPPAVVPPVEPPAVVPPVEPPAVVPPADSVAGGAGAGTDAGPAKTTGPTTGETNGAEVEEVVIDTEVLGETVLGETQDIEVGDITEVALTGGDIDEILGEVAGPTIASSASDADSGMGFMKVALIAIWMFVLLAAGMVWVLVNRRRAQES